MASQDGTLNRPEPAASFSLFPSDRGSLSIQDSWQLSVPDSVGFFSPLLFFIFFYHPLTLVLTVTGARPLELK